MVALRQRLERENSSQGVPLGPSYRWAQPRLSIYQTQCVGGASMQAVLFDSYTEERRDGRREATLSAAYRVLPDIAVAVGVNHPKRPLRRR